MRNGPPLFLSTWTQLTPGHASSNRGTREEAARQVQPDCMTGPLHENLLGAPEEKANLRRRVVSFREAGPVETLAVYLPVHFCRHTSFVPTLVLEPAL